MTHQETLATVAMLAPSARTFRQIMLAGRVFHVSLTAQLLVRTRFRQLVYVGSDMLRQILPSARQDGREFVIFRGTVYGFRYNINGQRHGVSKYWRDDRLDYMVHYHYGHLHGPSTTWHFNGQPQRRRMWEYGSLKGLQEQWDQNGRLVCTHVMV